MVNQGGWEERGLYEKEPKKLYDKWKGKTLRKNVHAYALVCTVIS